MSLCSLTDVVEISDRTDLLDIVSNEQVTQFSQSGAGAGFASAAVVLRLTGVEERRICKPGIDAIDLGLAVAEKLQQCYGFDWADCPAIGISHTHTIPGSQERLLKALSRELGVPRERFFSINFGCVGYLELLRQGNAHLAPSSGNGPVPLMSIETPCGWHDASDRSFCGIVSAGATGSLLQRDGGHQLLDLCVQQRPVVANPEGPQNSLFWMERAECLNFFGEREERTVMRMNGGFVFEQGTEFMIEACRKAWDVVSPTDRRVIVASHQPSGKMLQAMISALRDELPCLEFLNNMARYANSISSAIPTVLSHLNRILADDDADPIRPGDYVLLPAAGISMSNKATHMEQGWAVLRW